MTTPTLLGGALAGTTKPTISGSTRLSLALAGAPVHEPGILILPNGIEVLYFMTLVGSERLLDIEGETYRAMERRGIEIGVMTEHNFELERTARTLAEAIVERDAPHACIGSVADWGKLSPEQLRALWVRYGDLVQKHDPLAPAVDLSSAEIAEIREAIVKKNAMLLLYFGVARLSAYLLTTASQPAASVIPESSSGVI